MIFEVLIIQQTFFCVIISLCCCSLSNLVLLFDLIINWLIINVSAINECIIICYIYPCKKIFRVTVSFNFFITIINIVKSKKKQSSKSLKRSIKRKSSKIAVIKIFWLYFCFVLIPINVYFKFVFKRWWISCSNICRAFIVHIFFIPFKLP